MNVHVNLDAVADDIDADDPVDAQACRALWCAVLAAMWDLATRPGYRDSPAEVEGAQAWFGSRDFYTVCSLAGIDGGAALARYRAGVTLPVIRNECAAGRRAA